MATEWKSQQADGMFYLQFETDNKEKYMIVEKAAQMAIDGKTTADYAVLRHGEWIKEGNKKTCSVCGFFYHSNNDNWNGCPNCLAKMDGGKKE